MSEPKPIYNVDLKEPLPAIETTLNCPDCGNNIGKITEVGSRAWLKVGELRLYALHGRCGCGATLHWNASDVTLARLIDRSRKRKH